MRARMIMLNDDTLQTAARIARKVVEQKVEKASRWASLHVDM